jgi:hypothetical protein
MSAGDKEILPGDIVILHEYTMFISWLDDDIDNKVFPIGTFCLVVSRCPRKLIPRSWKFPCILDPCVILHDGKLKIATSRWMIKV